MDERTDERMDEPLRVDVWSDLACPWCYIGKRRFEQGLREYTATPGAREVLLTYRSFELAPDTPVDFDGSEIEFLVRFKRMPEAQVRQMIEHVTSVAASVGLAYDFEAVQHTNTVKAHQVIHHAAARGLQLEAVERLMSAYFCQGRHLGRDDELGALAADVGLDAAEVVQAVQTNTYLDAVRADEETAQAYGITGVPFYVVADRFGVSGAQPPEVFVDALTRAGGADGG
jgi:predicted DsbA family dithiol-disulfide isomerase